eukprot:scaffold27350_cov38-Tisochrysis_lutea.AAC.3
MPARKVEPEPCHRIVFFGWLHRQHIGAIHTPRFVMKTWPPTSACSLQPENEQRPRCRPVQASACVIQDSPAAVVALALPSAFHAR